MSKNLIFRIIGALSSALIIVSVFIPFISVTGYTINLWNTFESTNSLYLPIMLIVFGAIGVIFFALNKKTEFVYMTTGATSFFAIMETVDVLNQGVFNTLSIGYYFLVAGAILTGLMTFLINLKSNQNKTKIEPVNVQEQPSMLSQIDKLYDNQSMQNTIEPIQSVQDVIQPISVEQQNTINPIPVSQSIPVVSEQMNSIPNTIQPIESNILSPEIGQPIQPAVNPVLQEFASADLNQQAQVIGQVNQVETQNMVNSVPNIVQPIETPTMEQPTQTVENPVLKEFNQNNIDPTSQMVQDSAGQNAGTPSAGVEYDIFGQPINK